MHPTCHGPNDVPSLASSFGKKLMLCGVEVRDCRRGCSDKTLVNLRARKRWFLRPRFGRKGRCESQNNRRKLSSPLPFLYLLSSLPLLCLSFPLLCSSPLHSPSLSSFSFSSPPVFPGGLEPPAYMDPEPETWKLWALVALHPLPHRHTHQAHTYSALVTASISLYVFFRYPQVVLGRHRSSTLRCYQECGIPELELHMSGMCSTPSAI